MLKILKFLHKINIPPNSVKDLELYRNKQSIIVAWPILVKEKSKHTPIKLDSQCHLKPLVPFSKRITFHSKHILRLQGTFTLSQIWSWVVPVLRKSQVPRKDIGEVEKVWWLRWEGMWFNGKSTEFGVKNSRLPLYPAVIWVQERPLPPLNLHFPISKMGQQPLGDLPCSFVVIIKWDKCVQVFYTALSSYDDPAQKG